MVTEKIEEGPIEAAKRFGATVSGGMNWDFADFPTDQRAKAEEFAKWLVEHNYEHRGVYGPYDGNPVRVTFR